MHKNDWLTAGRPMENNSRVMIMVHGRGGSPQDIIAFAGHLPADDYSLLAPRATNNTWYPFSFMAPVLQNEPWLSSALDMIDKQVEELLEIIPSENLYFLGFSQGACLTLEYVSRHARKYGGVIAFTGGLIGREIDVTNYNGDFNSTPVFIGSSDPDPHVPVGRVEETEKVLKSMNASVDVRIYPGMGHTINQDEINAASAILSR